MPGDKNDVSLEATAIAVGSGVIATPAPRLGTQVRTTVLPRAQRKTDGPQLVQDDGHRYRPIKTLGAGGVGEVTLVRDHDIHRNVAVKRLRPEQDGAAAVMRFVDEIQTVGQLEHPGIVPIHDVGIDEQGKFFFVMKYVEGETIEEIISKLARGDADARARYPFERRAQVFLQVLRAVQFAHARGVIHRDIKPANVMVGRFGEVMVMDWGVAKRIADPDGAAPIAHAATLDPADAKVDASPERLFKTQHGSLLGTPAYMSPEQASSRNDEIDVRSDIYSLSALLFEMLFLRHYLPPQGSLAEMLHAVIAEAPVMKGHTTVPPDLLHLALKGLEKDPARRYQSVDEMIARLERTIAGRCDVSCPMTMMKRGAGEFSRFVDRYPLVSLFAFLAAMAILVYGAVQLVLHAI